MRTARLLTISWSIPCILGDMNNPAPPPLPQMQTPSLDADPLVMWPVMHAGKPTPSSREQTSTCENITLPQASFAGGND